MWLLWLGQRTIGASAAGALHAGEPLLVDVDPRRRGAAKSQPTIGTDAPR